MDLNPLRFRSTGSYEPDQRRYNPTGRKMCFDPQALTSLTSIVFPFKRDGSRFDPQALTSLTLLTIRTTKGMDGFDPQALTSLTK